MEVWLRFLYAELVDFILSAFTCVVSFSSHEASSSSSLCESKILFDSWWGRMRIYCILNLDFNDKEYTAITTLSARFVPGSVESLFGFELCLLFFAAGTVDFCFGSSTFIFFSPSDEASSSLLLEAKSFCESMFSFDWMARNEEN